ncbi:BRCA1-associated protein [Galdieria sulphuraria]|uniref:BRCA1-associated protein / zinc finger family protein isoform 1 n=1 Tax=Galdieria sulphuraria TaxID=130081 RepID=M2XFL2_GALSU|nr:BRCA1-associated protein / zinc finger family protein isoform 1 [Galdieria sulphuraria]EME28802.1 BRCA1-associated protein / zinc finger family protein isoform 1 [Galdieria sulphuraria]GJD07502.1 BRCA1-associated protein [Galdieria sulphuraria]|eukprot:XP_005705322.1 BRCA1-associated protein / zinc finger family protein isoform 1 [Galdieria sulphuraria]
MFCIQVENATKSSSSKEEGMRENKTKNSSEIQTQVVGIPVSGVECFGSPGEQSYTENIEFSAGNPLLETITGELHLYRSVEKGIYQMSQVLCVLAVPAYFTAADFCMFVGPFGNHIRNMRLLRDSRACNRYMVLIQFESLESAENFYRGYEGKLFSSIGPECCRILSVSSVVFRNTTNSKMETFPDVDTTLELPTCPVCLERLDSSVSGLITSLCNHTLHCSCLSKWGDNSCPVCRYCQEPVPESNSCQRCGTTQSLWMCLICGHVGCGRYVEFHALVHFKESSHTFAMELESGRVWDYVGDNYVHRLIVNKTDGKLVELPSLQEESLERPHIGASSSSLQESDTNDKKKNENDDWMDSILQQYDYLLTSQLESQREYYEQQLQQVDLDRNQKIAEMECEMKQCKLETDEWKKQYKQLEKEKKALQRQMAELQKNQEKYKEENTFLHSLNENLLRNQMEWKTKYTQLEKQWRQEQQQVQELQEELRDLRFHLSSMETILNGENQKESVENTSEYSHQTAEWKGGDVIGVAKTPQRKQHKDSHKRTPKQK